MTCTEECCLAPRSGLSLESPLQTPQITLIIPMPRAVIYDQTVTAFYSSPQFRKVPGILTTAVDADPVSVVLSVSKKILDMA